MVVRENYRMMLSEGLQKLYEHVYNVFKRKEEIGKVHVYIDDLEQYYKAAADISIVKSLVQWDHPEMLWLASPTDLTEDETLSRCENNGVIGGTVGIVGYNVRFNNKFYEEAFDAKLPKIFCGKSTKIETAKEIIRKMLLNIKYDLTSGIQSAYGVGCLGRGVCMGYAMYYKYLCNINDIDCRVVIGVAGNSKNSKESHAWCILNIDGRDIYVDPTWCDPVYDDGHQEHIMDERWFDFNPNDGTHELNMTFTSSSGEAINILEGYLDGTIKRDGWYGEKFDFEDLTLDI